LAPESVHAACGRVQRNFDTIEQMPEPFDSTTDLPTRPRRLRLQPQLREMLQRVHVRKSDLVLPLFVREGAGVKIEVPSMPGVYQMSVDVAAGRLAELASMGLKAFIVFGVIDRAKKDDVGSAALDPDNVVCQLLRRVRDQKLPLAAVTDLCLCEYTSHGHCGALTADQSTVDNDPTLNLLAQQAIHHARAGADVIAPSGMMDGAVRAIRRALDHAQFTNTAILSYAVKYASGFYGPFRDAADSAPAFGDRHSYQMDPARGVEEAILETRLDIEQGADMVMVKPAMPYLDVLAAVRKSVDVPVAAYQVSGEYAMLEAAIGNGWLDRERVVMESLQAIKRAGADLILTYYADRFLKVI